MDVTATQKFIRTSPRKIRLVTNLVRGWQPEKAVDQLRFVPKAASVDVAKAIKNALASAKGANLDTDKLIISDIRIDEGPRLKRRVIGSRGRSYPIKKRMSHITVKLSEKTPAEPNKEKPAAKKVEVEDKPSEAPNKSGE